MSVDFIPSRPPRAQEDGSSFKPAAYASARGFTSLLDTLIGGAAGPDFVPDLGDELDEAPERVLDIDAIREAAFAEGRAAAASEAAVEIAALRADLEAREREQVLAEALTDGVERLRIEALQRAAGDVATLALAMAHRVVGESLALAPEALLGVVKAAMERLPGEEEVTIRVRPEDLPMLEGRLRSRRAIKLVTDPEMEGGCVLESDFGSVDATLEAAMDGLSAAVERWRLEHQR